MNSYNTNYDSFESRRIRNLNKLNYELSKKNRILERLEGRFPGIICNLFEDMPYLIVSGSVNVEDIADFLENNSNKCIMITTYASSFKIYNVTQKNKFIFSMKINDEVHHLTSTNIKDEERKTYINMLKIKSEKQLSLTATLKLLENKENEREEDIIVSNDNVEYFGNIIDRKCLLWAINKNIICDYVIQTIITNEEQMEELFLRFNIVDENEDNDLLPRATYSTSISCKILN
tara:strand:- start:634 stop:1332 length:699 start_codon:yes stop_codon:yes gene_type:complete